MKHVFQKLQCVMIILVLFMSISGCSDDHKYPSDPETPYQVADISANPGNSEQMGAYVGDEFFRVNVPAGDYLLSYNTEKFGVSYLVFKAESAALLQVDLVEEDQVRTATLREGTVIEQEDLTYANGPVALYAWPGEVNGQVSSFWSDVFQFSSSSYQLVINDGKVNTSAGIAELTPSPETTPIPDPVPDPTEPTPSPETTPIPDPVPAPPDPNVLVSETLKDGQTVGTISDGSFTSEGVQLHGLDGYLGYSIPTTPNGYIEFSARGFLQDELHGGSEYKSVLLTMWSGDDGYSYEHVPFIFELRKYGYIEGRPDATNAFFFKIKSQGVWEEGRFHVLSWDPGRTYRIRVEWVDGHTWAFRDDDLVATGSYHGEFTPSNQKIQIGANPLRGRRAPEGLVISDVVIRTL